MLCCYPIPLLVEVSVVRCDSKRCVAGFTTTISLILLHELSHVLFGKRDMVFSFLDGFFCLMLFCKSVKLIKFKHCSLALMFVLFWSSLPQLLSICSGKWEARVFSAHSDGVWDTVSTALTSSSFLI